MAFPQKKQRLRPIHIDGVDYHYKVSCVYAGDTDGVVTIIWQSGFRPLIVHPDWVRPKGAWGDQTPTDKQRSQNARMAIFPSDVAYFIRLGLINGWEPKSKGAPCTIHLWENTVDDRPLTPLN